ncbi:predicted protein [Nematostella vectensis]|uniref:Sfi1 spindle body domain-containing protein n=1 Tax=Nematostella vectensis TaxID=45351 RepID=A7S4C9_NEMVE|nr:predicted protein [Nematostella vectensis]|eukprot:XP_001633561.1 predicted protein [Nematostella vectensis]
MATSDKRREKSTDSIVDDSDMIDMSFYDLPQIQKKPVGSNSYIMVPDTILADAYISTYRNENGDTSRIFNGNGTHNSSASSFIGKYNSKAHQDRSHQQANGSVLREGTKSDGHTLLSTDISYNSLYSNGLRRPFIINNEETLMHYATETESTCSSGIAADIETSPKNDSKSHSKLTNGSKYINNRSFASLSSKTPMKAKHVQSNVPLLDERSLMMGNNSIGSHGKQQFSTPRYTTPPTHNTSIYYNYSDTNYGHHLRDAQLMSVRNEAQVVFGNLSNNAVKPKQINKQRNHEKPHQGVVRNGKGHPLYRDLSLMNSFSVDSSRRISSAVWAMKLLDVDNTPSSPSFQQMLLKARIFRRWHQRVRLRRLIRMEIDSKMNSAVTFWQYSTLRSHFKAWRSYRQHQQYAADQLHRRHMLQTGMRGLRFVVQFNTQLRQDAFIRLNGRLMAKYWLKWQNHLKQRKAEALKTAFNRWRVFKLEENRDKILEGMVTRHILSKNYSKWKQRYHVEQSTSVAGLHFKITLLTKCWHGWRVYAAQGVVKSRLNEVARVHFEDNVQERLFRRWVKQTKKSTAATTLLKRKIVLKAFYSWRNWTEYAKVLHQRFQSMCKEYYNRALVRQTFVKWKHKLLARQAEKFHRDVVQRRVYRLWFLRHRRKVIHRHLCKAMAKKGHETRKRHYHDDVTKRGNDPITIGPRNSDDNITTRPRNAVTTLSRPGQETGKKRRFFRLWADATRSQQKRREILVTTLQRMLLSNTMNRWKKHTNTVRSLRARHQFLTSLQDTRAVRNAFSKWMFAMKVVNFTKMARARWSDRCVRRACEQWKLMVRCQRLERVLIENRPRQELWVMRDAFGRWMRALQEATAVKQRARSAAAILARNTKRRILQGWRVTNQQDQIISPMVMRRRRKHMARAFDAWRLHIYRQKYIVDQQVRAKENLLLRHFMHWRGRTRLRLKEQNAVDKLHFSNMRRAFAAWRGHVRECRHERLRERAMRLQLMGEYYKRWLDRTHVRIEAKDIQLGHQARHVVLTRWAFKAWRQSATEQKERLAQTEQRIAADHRRLVVTKAFRVWHRLHQVISLPGRMDLVDAVRIASPITVLREATHTKSPLAMQSPLAVQSPVHTPISLPHPIAMNGSSESSSPELHLQLPSLGSDNVFTPVRVEHTPPRGEAELTRMFSISSEDDEFDRQSVTSGTSCMSMRDKEMVLTDTILHWRALPLSLTFRTWLKYTRQRKLLRELLFYFREKRRMEHLAHALCTWRRELYIKVAARQYLRDGTRQRCLRAWHEYVQTRRMKEDRHVTAQQQSRTRLLRLSFRVWKDKYTAKRRLQSIVGQWQKKAIVEEKYKSIQDKVQASHEARVVRARFQYWLKVTRKSQEARRFYLDSLLPKFFVTWHAYASERSTRRRQATSFRDSSLTRTAFKEWLRRFEAVKKTEQYIEVKATNTCVEILQVWHDWAHGVSTRRAQWRAYRRSLEIKQMREIFSLWLSGAQQLQAAQRIHEQAITKRVFLSWRNEARSRLQNKFNAKEFSIQCSQNLLARSFQFWKRLYTHRQKAVAHAAARDLETMRSCYRDWRDFALECRAEKHYINNVIKSVYFRWYDTYVSRKKARSLIQSWKVITQDSKNLNSKAMEVCQQSERKLLHRAFMLWVQEAHKLEKAKAHSSTIAMRCALIAWHQLASTKARCKRVLAERQEERSKELISRSFKLWKDSFHTALHNLKLLDEHTERKNQQTLVACMLQWRKHTLKCRSGKHYQARLVIKSFMLWKDRLVQKKGLQDIVQRMFVRRTRQAAIHWMQWTKRSQRQQQEAGEFEAHVMRLRVERSFRYWKTSTEHSLRARRHLDQIVLARGFIAWRKTVKIRVDERKKIEKFRSEVMQRKVSRMFNEWKTALTAAQGYNKLVSGQLKKHHQRMLAGAMREWRRETLCSRAEKHYRTMLTARFFLDWKTVYDDRLEEKKLETEKGTVADLHYRQHLCKVCFRAWMHDARMEKYLEMKQQRLVQNHFDMWKKKSNLKAIASELGDHRLYHKYWSKWRHQLVRKRVSELMMKHEEKKLLSEVFGSWLRLTTIRRRLLHEWNLAQVEKWFRLWMKKYNES